MTAPKRHIRRSLLLALGIVASAGLGLLFISWLAYALDWVPHAPRISASTGIVRETSTHDRC
jgi:hypothetical protein